MSILRKKPGLSVVNVLLKRTDIPGNSQIVVNLFNVCFEGITPKLTDGRWISFPGPMGTPIYG